jgi:light-regulated signal transduction histidine kinase (bacteriophytochrome)
MSSTSVDLLEALRAALDEVEPLLTERVVDIEMSRLRVLADPVSFPREFAALIEAAVTGAPPSEAITIRVARAGAVARIEVVGAGVGAQPGDVIGSMTLRLVPGAASAADA